MNNVQEPRAQSTKFVHDKLALHDSEIPVIRRIEHQAKKTPDKIAVFYGRKQVSYASLISFAKRSALELKEFGVVRGSRVAVLMHPAPDLIWSLLGIHMLGGTYVPIDPGFPVTRIRMILEDVEPAAIICTKENLSTLRSVLPDPYRRLLYPSNFSKKIEQGQIDKFVPYPVELEDESHIFFTSGTTGRPKGAISTHRNLAHGMSSSAACFEFTSEHGIFSVAGSSFSISTFELLSLLACGGYTAIAQRSDILDIEKLFESARQASVWHFVPTLLARLIEYIEQTPERVSALNNLQRILTGGDNVPPDLLSKIRLLLPEVKLYVNYGASETNCMVTYWPVQEKTIGKTKIGIPQKNVNLLVLNKKYKEVSPGNIGELYVDSPGVIMGYMHREDLNQEKFLIREGSRFFATGDMVRVDENGLYEMLGREDFQIQLNGNRIELLEVESIIKQVSGIKDCVVAVKNIGNIKTPTLTAFVVPSNQSRPSLNEIKTFVKDLLPSYMVPSLYLELSKIPTNHNGKVDRANLPDPGNCEILQSSEDEPLQGSVEQSIANTWENLLAGSSIHANSDFFELGGDSITAVRAMARISEDLGCRLTIADIVKNTTVRALASKVSQQLSTPNSPHDDKSNDIPGCQLLKKGHSNLPPLLLINGVVEYLDLVKELRTDRSVYAVYLPEEVDLIVNGAKSNAIARTSSIKDITKLYLSIITTLQPTGPYFLAGKSYGGIIAIEVGRELESQGHSVAFTGLLDTVVPEAFTSHKKIAFRVLNHIKCTLHEGPSYLVSRIKLRYFGRNKHKGSSLDTFQAKNDGLDNVRVRHKVRKNAILTTRLSPVKTPLTLIKARDRKYLYGEQPSKDLGWTKYSSQLTVYEVPGDHHSILMASHVDKVARHIEAHI
ncbi:AMP-binding protein [Microbulbifer bruguierae]|uniref:AMP-binding protein n=1 Tax=Microbulbifer bruguierae TaxID=3029061 RepID=A0ABY8N8K7_9GAMM|nr:AMP-binding protein [Microbulbifer bruguierae]WGL15241.1 AMP-binding protein [Microbulbifer bruguierae]